MEFQSRSRLNRQPEQLEFFLSDMPFESLRNQSPFFKSTTGKLGRIVRIDASYKGADPEVFLSIKWDGVEELSFVVWPDECTKLPVDMTVVGKHLKPYCDAQIGRHLKHVAFYILVAEDKKDTGNDNVIEETAVKVIPTA